MTRGLPRRAGQNPACGHIGTLERLPKWLKLVPIVAQWIWLSLRYRSITLPSTTNPFITTGGLVGEGKMEYLEIMGPCALGATARTTSILAHRPTLTKDAANAMAQHGLSYPVVVKPDLGWCGFGVRKIDRACDLHAYLAAFPAGERVVIQEWIDQPGEAGIFYMRRADQKAGALIGMLLREFPRVTGDGVHTVGELIAADERGRRLGQDGKSESCADLFCVPAIGEVVRIANVGSTRVGGVYKDGSDFITPALTAAIDAVACDMKEFHAGRFDVKFSSLESLQSGRFTILEVNGAGSEAVHAWDPSFTLARALRIIFDKQRQLFALGAEMRLRGHPPVGCMELLRHHMRQQKLINRYPPSN